MLPAIATSPEYQGRHSIGLSTVLPAWYEMVIRQSRTPLAGKLVSNPALEGTLPTEVNFTQEELAIFNIAYLHFADCIMSKINDISYYFRPAAGKFEHIGPINQKPRKNKNR